MAVIIAWAIVFWILSIFVVITDSIEKQQDTTAWGIVAILLPGLGLLLYAIAIGSRKAWGTLFLIVAICLFGFLFTDDHGNPAPKTAHSNHRPSQPIYRGDPVRPPYYPPLDAHATPPVYNPPPVYTPPPTPPPTTETHTTFMSNGTMRPIANSGVTANINVNPNRGTYGDPFTVTIVFTSGAEQVDKIMVYGMKEATGWDYAMLEDAITPSKQSGDTWYEGQVMYIYDGPAVLRFYAIGSDGQALAVGDINKDGGGPAIPADSDGVFDGIQA